MAGPLIFRRDRQMEENLKELSRLIQEADAIADRIKALSGGNQAVEQNVVRMKACLKMLKIGVVEPLEMAG
jgi:hypothetical protein